MLKKYIKTIATLLILLGIYLFAVKIGLIPSPARLFRAAPVVIDNTPLLIKEIKQVSELVTLSSFDEVVVSSIKPAAPGSARHLLHLVTPLAPISADRLVLVVKGEVQVGTDLATITNDQVYTKEDSVSITISPAKVLAVITNPSGVSTFIEEGDWSPAEVTALKQKAVQLLQQRCIEKGLLKKADVQALIVLQQFLKALGYKKTSVATKL
jgi:hypothetical protein